MSLDLSHLRTYVERMEKTVCGEWHDDSWPECLHEDHAEGLAVLSALDCAPGYLVNHVS